MKLLLLDHRPITVDADEVEVVPSIPGLERERDEVRIPAPCAEGQPMVRYKDGTTIWVHCPAEGTSDPFDYTVASARPHGWNIAVTHELRNGIEVRVAKIGPFLRD